MQQGVQGTGNLCEEVASVGYERCWKGDSRIEEKHADFDEENATEEETLKAALS